MPHTAKRRAISRCSAFQLEAEMATPVMTWLVRNRLSVKPQFALPWGICDLVGVKLDPTRAKLRLSYGQTRPLGSIPRLMILSKIPESESGKSTNLKRLTKQLWHMDPENLSKEINFLLHCGFVVSPKRGRLQKRNGWAPLHQRIVAVELKLHRVPEAINQAKSNQAFATESYVALPYTRAIDIVRNRKADAFIRNGIGLLAVRNHSCRELIKPKSNSSAVCQLIQSHVVERFWRTRDS